MRQEYGIRQEYHMIEAITFELVKYFQSNLGHKVNLFSNLNLFNTLKQREIWAVGKICNNSLQSADKLMKPKKPLKEGRGTFDYRVDKNINVTIIWQMIISCTIISGESKA